MDLESFNIHDPHASIADEVDQSLTNKLYQNIKQLMLAFLTDFMTIDLEKIKDSS